MKKQEAVNTFQDGLILDLNPLSMPNNALTNCLNGTMLTYNGNENMLQNDMGNCRVETAMLPAGYIPLGSTSFGGIIYIVSYNPINKKYQIGSFPSPERNLTKDDIGDDENSVIYLNKFCSNQKWENKESLEINGETIWNNGFGSPNNIITHYYQKVNLTKDPIYPGDKYKVFSKELSGCKDILSAYGQDSKFDANKLPKYLKFDIIATLDNGKIITLTDNSTWTVPEKKEGGQPFYIYLNNIEYSNEQISVSEYRGLVGSNYDTYVSKLSGQLGIVARLEVPTSFSVGYEVLTDNVTNPKAGPLITKDDMFEEYQFYLYLNWANDNTGEDKNRINPSHIRYVVCSGDHCLDHQEQLIKLYTNLERKEEKVPNSIDGDDYFTTVIPTINGKSYYDKDFPIEKYLKELDNQPPELPGVTRRNDMTDFQYVIKGPTIYKNSKGEFVSNMEDPSSLLQDDLTITITPCMPFGQLEFLEKKIYIRLNDLLSGNIYLNNYQYYVDSSEINMEFNIEAYPETGKGLLKGRIEFFPLSDHIVEEYWQLQETYSNNVSDENLISSNDSISVDLNAPYNGFQHITIDKSEKKFVDNKIYIAKISLLYGSRSDDQVTFNRHFYRLFFNSNTFNNAYNTNQDFKDLYLYDADKNYGIKPAFKFDTSTSSGFNDEAVARFPRYLGERGSVQQNQVYSIEHGINSSYSVISGLNDINISMSGVSKESVKRDIIVPSGVEKYEKSEPNISINDTSMQLESRFDINIPGTAFYYDIQSLIEYTLEKLADGNEFNKVMLSHYSEESEEGALSLFISGTDSFTDVTTDSFNSPLVSEQYFFPNETKNGLADLSSVYGQLRGILTNSDPYDYITVLFGVAQMKDDNCGYGERALDGHSKGRFCKFHSKPEDAFMKLDCIRQDDSVILLHTKNPQLNYRKHGSKSSTNDRKYSTLLNTAFDGKVIKDTYRKYKRSSNRKTLYFINDIACEINPTVNTEYQVGLNIEKLAITVGSEEVPQDNETALNLSVKGLQKFTCVVPISNIIDNKDWINDQRLLTFNNQGWDPASQEIIPYDRLYKVVDEKNNIVEGLVIDEQTNTLRLDNDFRSKCIPTEWYFGWEDVFDDGSAQTGMKYNLNQFLKYNNKEPHQYYKVQYMYQTTAFTSTGSVDDPEYAGVGEYEVLPINADNFVQGSKYELSIRRIQTPSNFQESTIFITCLGGTVDESSFIDPAGESFSTTIHVTPTEEICTVELTLDHNPVGSYIFKDVSTSE